MRLLALTARRKAMLPYSITMYVAIITTITSGKNMPSATAELSIFHATMYAPASIITPSIASGQSIFESFSPFLGARISSMGFAMRTRSVLYTLVTINMPPKNTSVIAYAFALITKRLPSAQSISLSSIQNASWPNMSAQTMPSISPRPSVNRFSHLSTRPTCRFSSPSTAYRPNSRFLRPIRKLFTYSMKKNANMLKTTMPKENMACVVSPLVKLARP